MQETLSQRRLRHLKILGHHGRDLTVKEVGHEDQQDQPSKGMSEHFQHFQLGEEVLLLNLGLPREQLNFQEVAWHIFCPGDEKGFHRP